MSLSHTPARTRLGFNGEYLERSGVQILGSYRAYNPVLLRFHAPDEQSPFRRGGLNTYTYCLGDPVNLTDPTGHWAQLLRLVESRKFIGATAGMVIAMGVGSFLIKDDQVRTAVQWTALLPLAGMVAGGAVRYLKRLELRHAPMIPLPELAGSNNSTPTPRALDDLPPSYAEFMGHRSKYPPLGENLQDQLPRYDSELVSARRNSLTAEQATPLASRADRIRNPLRRE